MPPARVAATPRARASRCSGLPATGPARACSKSAWPKWASSVVGVLAVEVDELGQRARARRRCGSRGSPSSAGAELGEQHQQLVVPDLVAQRRQVGVVDDGRALGGQQRERPLGGGVGVRGVAPERRARHPDPLARQPPGDGVRRVVGAVARPARSAARPRRRPCAAIGPGESWDRRDRHDAVGGDRADRRLDADAAVEGGRAGDRAVGLGADGVAARGRPPPRRRCPSSEPPAERLSAYGLRVSPPYALQPDVERSSRMLAHSDRLVLPSTTIPASRSRATSGASWLRWRDVGQRQRPAVVGRSAVSMLSLPARPPWRGPRTAPSAASRVEPVRLRRARPGGACRPR